MAAGSQSQAGPDTDSGTDDRPQVSLCESAPGTAVFLEAGNSDGWIASDLTIDIDP